MRVWDTCPTFSSGLWEAINRREWEAVLLRIETRHGEIFRGQPKENLIEGNQNKSQRSAFDHPFWIHLKGWLHH